MALRRSNRPATMAAMQKSAQDNDFRKCPSTSGAVRVFGR